MMLTIRATTFFGRGGGPLADLTPLSPKAPQRRHDGRVHGALGAWSAITRPLSRPARGSRTAMRAPAAFAL